MIHGGFYGALAVACMGGTCVEVLLDTGATKYLIRSEVARNREDKPEIRPYEGHSQLTDGRGLDVDENITANLNLGLVDVNLYALLVAGLKNQIILELRSMKENIFCLEFVYDDLLNLVRHATPKLVRKLLPTVPTFLGGQGESNSECQGSTTVRGPESRYFG